MRSHSILRKSHLLSKLSPLHSLPIRHTWLAVLAFSGNRVLSSNSSPPPPTDPHETSSVASPIQFPEPLSDDTNPLIQEEQVKPAKQDKPSKQRRPRIILNGKELEAPLELPDELDILWSPTDSGVTPVSTSDILPSSDMLEDPLDSLLLTLHPKNQHRAVYPSGPSGQLVEPTLGIYCPLEGGHCVVDATVRELASRTGSEVLVLDAVQLAAGEWGAFGKVASALELPKNTLHFSSSPPYFMESSHVASSVVEEEEEEQPPIIFSATFKAVPPMQRRSLIASPTRRTAPSTSNWETFFEMLVNLPSASEGSDNTPKNRPRLIYIRDFPIIASSSSVWYPSLLAAVRNRRKGPISRPSSVVASPTTIIFGLSSPLAPPKSSSNSLRSLEGRKSENDDWNESEVAELSREERFRTKIRKWYGNTRAVFDECPKLFTKQESRNSSLKPIVVIGSPNGPSGFSSSLGLPSIRFGMREPDGSTGSQFFRFSAILPNVMTSSQLRDARVNRRREINELIMRMEIGAMGGVLESISPESALTNVESGSEPSQTQTSSPLCKMWEKWGNEIEEWENVRAIADRAMGSVMVLQHLSGKKATLEPTVVPWTTLQTAWAARQSWRENADLIAADEKEDTSKAEGNDKVVESVKDDPELDSHEQRLISCIVDPNSIKTSFKQVHLPPHTIDSVRTIVSLPLLHPYAFQQGILKDYSMTGCLLFGPPGTGKTLVVRALAREAGCRMLAISPSDVMDMYVGEGEKLVKAVFSLARRLSPCVVFLDEIDALFGARVSHRESGAATHRGIINEFMQEMDGLKSSISNNVIVIGATNRPFDLDDAVLRRLPRRLLVDLPGQQERQEILRILLRDESLAADVTIEMLAARTDCFSGSDLKHLCVSAALDSVKEHVKLPWKQEPLIASSPAINLESPSSTTISSQQQFDKNLTKDESLPSSLSEPIAPGATLDNEASPSPEQPLDSNVPNDKSPQSTPPPETPVHPIRVLHLRNFLQAQREITPSSSESFGSLAELRKWNEEFGEGRRDRKKRQVWGKGQFGFVEHGNDRFQEGRVDSQPKS